LSLKKNFKKKNQKLFFKFFNSLILIISTSIKLVWSSIKDLIYSILTPHFYPQNPTTTTKTTKTKTHLKMSSPPPNQPQENGNGTEQEQTSTALQQTSVPPPSTLNSFRVFGSRFILDSRYTPRRGLGKGAYGIVISAVDEVKNEQVAIKKIPKMFQDLVDAKRILREVKLLRHFDHQNVIKLRDVLPSYGEFEELYIVLDFMAVDAHKIIYSNNHISLDHVKFMLYQILSGLKYIHAANVIHRDLKPSNILINADTTLKICDFGLARGYQEADYLTEYVVTRWYRAPEVMCSSDAYDFKIDIWAVGCILAEMINRNPLFPGDDYKRQLNLIFNAIGTPTANDTKFITNEHALSYIRNLQPRQPTPMKHLVQTDDADCLDLLTKMLKFNPHERISIDDALQHPFLRVYYEWNNNHNFTPPKQWDSSFETFLQDSDLTKLAIQQYLLREIFEFHPTLKPNLGRRYELLDQRGELLPEPQLPASPHLTPQEQQRQYHGQHLNQDQNLLIAHYENIAAQQAQQHSILHHHHNVSSGSNLQQIQQQVQQQALAAQQAAQQAQAQQQQAQNGQDDVKQRNGASNQPQQNNYYKPGDSLHNESISQPQ